MIALGVHRLSLIAARAENAVMPASRRVHVTLAGAVVALVIAGLVAATL